MFSVGIDAVEIERIREAMKNPRFITRIFSERERYETGRKANAAQSFAANWAAKEAFAKAVGTGIRGFSMNEVSVLHKENGKPYIELSGRAEKLFSGYMLDISLTHTDSVAMAAVIAWKR